MITEQSIENVKARIDIIEVIENYIELKKNGANFKSNCPFHSENTPSFVISPSKQIYKCFGCGTAGDAIKFVMEYEKLTYPEAIEKLANQFGVHLKYSNNHQNNSSYNKKILENLNLFFIKELDKTQKAKEYLTFRGTQKKSVEKFGIGYAPQSSLTLDFLRQNNVPLDEALELGLVAHGDNNEIYARFTNRIIFPIFTPLGKLVGFGGRIITNRTDIGKYINSPQGKLFDKSTLLYGYHIAKTSIMKKSEAIVVEGNLDMVMLHQAGFDNSVATLGTALTNKHISILNRGNPRVILAYDGDKAGQKALFKASCMLSAAGMSGGVVFFNDGIDPADMVKDGKIEELKQILNNTKPLIEFCINYIANQYSLVDPMQKEEAFREIMGYLKTLSPILQGEYKGYISAILNIKESLIVTKEYFKDVMVVDASGEESSNEDIAELTILKTIIEDESLIDFVLDVTDKDIFQTHLTEFELIVNDEFENDKIMGIKIRDDIKTVEYDELRKQIISLTIRSKMNKLSQIKHLKTNIVEKANLIRGLRNDIGILKKNRFVPCV